MPLFTVRGMLRSPLAARSSEEGIEDRLLDVFGRVDSWSGRRDMAHTGMLDFSGLVALVDDSVPEGGPRRGGLPAFDDTRCTVATGQEFWPGVDLGGLWSWLFFRGEEGGNCDIEFDVPARSEIRTGEGSRDEKVEVSVEGGAEIPGGVVSEENLGIWDRRGDLVCDLMAVDCGTSIMSPSGPEGRDVHAAASSSSLGSLDRPDIPLR